MRLWLRQRIARGHRGALHLTPPQQASLSQGAAALASQGFRVLGVARGNTFQVKLPRSIMVWRWSSSDCLVSKILCDRRWPAAVAECQAAGVRVVMITGDYPTTAQNIARQAGIANTDRVNLRDRTRRNVRMKELPRQLRKRPGLCPRGSRQKLRIVNALKANQEIVAMTGDGVNDAPALKAAHIASPGRVAEPTSPERPHPLCSWTMILVYRCSHPSWPAHLRQYQEGNRLHSRRACAIAGLSMLQYSLRIGRSFSCPYILRSAAHHRSLVCSHLRG